MRQQHKQQNSTRWIANTSTSTSTTGDLILLRASDGGDSKKDEDDIIIDLLDPNNTDSNSQFLADKTMELFTYGWNALFGTTKTEGSTKE